MCITPHLASDWAGMVWEDAEHLAAVSTPFFDGREGSVGMAPLE
jgi:hypothetical protein